MLFFKKVKILKLFLPSFLGFCFLVISPKAQATLVFCNNTTYRLETALGYYQNHDWYSEGWWRIEPNQCRRIDRFPRSKPLPHQFYYYASALTTPNNQTFSKIWRGNTKFCITEKPFRIKGIDCDRNGYKTTGFQIIKVKSTTRNYTLNFKDRLEKTENQTKTK